MKPELKANIEQQKVMAHTVVDDLSSNGLSSDELNVSALLDTLACNGLVLAPISGEHNISSLAYFDEIGLNVEEMLARG